MTRTTVTIFHHYAETAMSIDTVDPRGRHLGGRALGAAAAFGSTLLALMLLMGAAHGAEGNLVGNVGRVVGEVSLLRGAESVPAGAGAELREGDGIVTGPGSRVEILCADGSSIVIGPDTTVSVAEFAPSSGGASRALMDLISGILRVTLSGRTPWQSFEVRSATAVASVRSTDWIVDASRVKTGVFVVGGAVAVTSRAGAGEVVLAAGEGTDVHVNAVPTAPKAWGQPRIDDVLARTAMQ